MISSQKNLELDPYQMILVKETSARWDGHIRGNDPTSLIFWETASTAESTYQMILGRNFASVETARPSSQSLGNLLYLSPPSPPPPPLGPEGEDLW